MSTELAFVYIFRLDWPAIRNRPFQKKFRSIFIELLCNCFHRRIKIGNIDYFTFYQIKNFKCVTTTAFIHYSAVKAILSILWKDGNLTTLQQIPSTHANIIKQDRPVRVALQNWKVVINVFPSIPSACTWLGRKNPRDCN